MKNQKIPQDLNLSTTEQIQTFNRTILYQHTTLLIEKRSYKVLSYKEIAPY